MAYLHVTNCAKRSVLVCLVTMLVFLLRLYGDSLGWDLLKISAYKGLPGEIFEINLIHALSLRSCKEGRPVRCNAWLYGIEGTIMPSALFWIFCKALDKYRDKLANTIFAYSRIERMSEQETAKRSCFGKPQLTFRELVFCFVSNQLKRASLQWSVIVYGQIWN